MPGLFSFKRPMQTKFGDMIKEIIDHIYSDDGTRNKIAIYQIHWNHHTWTFTDEREAWLFAAYWKLI